VAPTRSPPPASDPNQAAPGPTAKRSQPRPATMDRGRAASRLPAPTANPAGDGVDHLRAATAAIRNQGRRPRQDRTRSRHQRARLNSHRPLGVQAAIRSDRRPAARHHGPSAPGGSRPAMLMPVHVGPVSRGQRLTSERSHSERGCVLSHIELGDRDRDQGHQAVAQHLPPRRPAVGFRPDVTLQLSWWAVLRLVGSRHAKAATVVWRQIIKASSSNATATRRVTGSSTASS